MRIERFAEEDIFTIAKIICSFKVENTIVVWEYKRFCDSTTVSTLNVICGVICLGRNLSDDRRVKSAFELSWLRTNSFSLIKQSQPNFAREVHRLYQSGLISCPLLAAHPEPEICNTRHLTQRANQYPDSGDFFSVVQLANKHAMIRLP